MKILHIVGGLVGILQGSLQPVMVSKALILSFFINSNNKKGRGKGKVLSLTQACRECASTILALHSAKGLHWCQRGHKEGIGTFAWNHLVLPSQNSPHPCELIHHLPNDL